jgi:hypothetical protein
MPESLRPTWEALHNEVVAVHSRWIIYRQLFAESEERVKILNECAAHFFSVIQATLLYDVQLTLSKLADPASTNGKANATLALLVKEIDALKEQPLTDQLNDLLTKYRASCKQIKTRRNKQIAHFDHATLLQQYGTGPADLPGPSRQEIEDALAALRCFMEPVEVYLTSCPTAYQAVHSISDGEALISVLQEGLRYQDLQKDGVIAWDDRRKSSRFGS